MELEKKLIGGEGYGSCTVRLDVYNLNSSFSASVVHFVLDVCKILNSSFFFRHMSQ